MDEIVKNISSGSWWIGVVIVGISLNLLSAYLKAPIDRLLSAVFERWRARSLESKRRSVAVRERLKVDPIARNDLWRAEVRARFRCVTAVVFGILLLIFYVNQRLRFPSLQIDDFAPLTFWFLRVTYLSSAFCQLFAFQQLITAANCANLLRTYSDEGEVQTAGGADSPR